MNDQKTMWDHNYATGQKVYTGTGPLPFAQEIAPAITPDLKLLELGCGAGSDAIYFAGLGADVIATDFSPVAIQEAKDKGETPNLTFELMDLAQPLPFESATFDVVYSHASLHYYNEETTEVIFKEIARVLKPGGMLYFSCKSPSDPKYGEGTEVEPGVFDRNGHLRHFFSPDYTRRLLAADYEIVKLEEVQEYYIDYQCGFVRAWAKKR